MSLSDKKKSSVMTPCHNGTTNELIKNSVLLIDNKYISKIYPFLHYPFHLQ
jgi:hypothetical protein